MVLFLKTSRWSLKLFSCLPFKHLLLFTVFIFAKAISALEKTPIGNAQTEMGKNITEILNTIITKGYDKRVRPNYAGPPVDVGIAVYIISISSVSEVQMDFTADIYFRQSWRDNRLSFQSRAGINQMVVGAEVANYVWNPDTFFGNEKSAQFHKATTPNTFIRIGSNGEVTRSTRLTVTSTCPMNLRYFPMDRQECTIEVESYGYSMSDIMYRWGIGNKPGVEMAEVKLPQFKVKGFQNKSIIQDEASGKYSRLICEIELVRSLGYYLIQIYIPSSLIVIISWVSFWLHRNASPARVQLGVTTVLTMTTLMSSTNAALPKISYVKSIDVFLGTCFVMVFAALLEYATVGYMGKRIALRTAKMQAKQMNSNSARRQTGVKAIVSTSQVEMGPILRPPHMVSQSVCEPLLGHPSLRLRRPEGETTYTTAGSAVAPASGPGTASAGGATGNAVSAAEHQTPRPSVDVPKKKESEPAEPAPSIPYPGSKPASTLFGISPSDIDKYSRVIFPVCFLCFHLMYWLIYTHISSFLEIEAEEPSS